MRACVCVCVHVHVCGCMWVHVGACVHVCALVRQRRFDRRWLRGAVSTTSGESSSELSRAWWSSKRQQPMSAHSASLRKQKMGEREAGKEKDTHHQHTGEQTSSRTRFARFLALVAAALLDLRL